MTSLVVRRGAGIATIAIASCLTTASACRGPTGTPVAAVPDSFVVALETSRGRVDLMARKSWSPIAAGRLYDLVNENHFDGARFFRVINGYVAQFGLSGKPEIDKAWRGRRLEDEPVKHSNTRGTVSFARGGPGTRSVQLFINLVDNQMLDTLGGFGFPPVAEVVSGLAVVDSLYGGYGDASPKSGAQPGREGPSQDSIVARGNAYLAEGWPKLDSIATARIVQRWPAAAPTQRRP
jgi:cyclophilin family peptidyl-prolyl cis-trans isomerase